MKPFRLTPQLPTEDNEQINVARWLDARRVRYCAVPNGGKRDPIVGARLKRSGVKPGVPDLLIFDPPPRYTDRIGAAIEMKRRQGSTVSELQREWLLALSERGWLTAVCRGWHEAVEFLQSAGYGAQGR